MKKQTIFERFDIDDDDIDIAKIADAAIESESEAQLSDLGLDAAVEKHKNTSCG